MTVRRIAAVALATFGLIIGQPGSVVAKGPMMLGILGGDLPSEVRTSVEETERFRTGPFQMFVPGHARPAQLSARFYIIREYLVPGPHMIRRDGRSDPIPAGDWTYYPAWAGHPAIVRFEAFNSPDNEWWRLASAFEKFVNAKIAAALGVDVSTVRGRAPASTSVVDDFPLTPLAAAIVGAVAITSAMARGRRRSVPA